MDYVPTYTVTLTDAERIAHAARILRARMARGGRMMRGVCVKLLKLPPIPPCGWTLAGLKVGDIGYVTAADYARRLVAVRFEYGEVWLSTADVAHVTAADYAKRLVAVRLEYGEVWLSTSDVAIDPYWTAPYMFARLRAARRAYAKEQPVRITVTRLPELAADYTPVVVDVQAASAESWEPTT